MHEIIFRIWDGEKMRRVAEVRLVDEPMRVMDELGNSHNNPPLMQYSCLKDKNGKEIFEGDIVYRAKGNFEIVWFPDNLCYGYKQGVYWAGMLLPEDSETTEIIGNIYENSDLLQ